MLSINAMWLPPLTSLLPSESLLNSQVLTYIPNATTPVPGSENRLNWDWTVSARDTLSRCLQRFRPHPHSDFFLTQNEIQNTFKLINNLHAIPRAISEGE